MNYLQPERLDRLAREYALGTLAGGARRRFERVLRESPAALFAVGVWQERLTPLSGSVPPMQPRAAVWQGLEARLFEPADAAVVRTRPAPWRWLADLLSPRTLGGALAGVLLCVLVLRLQPELIGMEPQRETLPASYVGLLLDAGGQPAVLASSRRQGRQLTVKLLQPLVVPDGTVAQLWALPRDGSAAFPVAVLPPQGGGTVALPDTSEQLFSAVARLAISFEPAPAARGATPTAPLVLSGHCVKLW